MGGFWTADSDGACVANATATSVLSFAEQLEQECNIQACPIFQPHMHAWGPCVSEMGPAATTGPVRHVKEQETVCVLSQDPKLLAAVEACYDPLDGVEGLATEYEVWRNVLEYSCLSQYFQKFLQKG
jgi:hypothetical protein